MISASLPCDDCNRVVLTGEMNCQRTGVRKKRVCVDCMMASCGVQDPAKIEEARQSLQCAYELQQASSELQRGFTR